MARIYGRSLVVKLHSLFEAAGSFKNLRQQYEALKLARVDMKEIADSLLRIMKIACPNGIESRRVKLPDRVESVLHAIAVQELIERNVAIECLASYDIDRRGQHSAKVNSCLNPASA